RGRGTPGATAPACRPRGGRARAPVRGLRRARPRLRRRGGAASPRPPLVPVGRLLVGVGGAEDGLVFMGPPNQREPGRQAVDEAARNAGGGQAGETPRRVEGDQREP